MSQSTRLNLPQLAAEFMRSFQTGAGYSRPHIANLAEAATSTDPAVARAASETIFGDIVEPLADRFEPSAISLYNRVFAQIVQHCRASMPELDAGLTFFGISTED